MIFNFSIISHIDHGKSTLADRLLELTGTVRKLKEAQFLDKMTLEREHGITIKMHPVRMNWRLENGEPCVLNLIDTPGHIDFSYETSRALKAVEGAVLLVDATQGIQAQTITVIEMAQKEGVNIIPAVNKIDLPSAKVAETKKEISEILNISESEVLEISGKTGLNVENLLNVITKRVPAAKEAPQKPVQALVFDSVFDDFLGVTVYVRIFGGTIKTGDKLVFLPGGIEVTAKEVGYFTPELIEKSELKSGEIGYVKTGVKEINVIKTGMTIAQSKESPIIPGYKSPQPMVYVSIYPERADDIDFLKKALYEIKLQDPAIEIDLDKNLILGQGFRCGFLGLLHFQITVERLEKYFGLNIITTLPSLRYRLVTQEREREIFSLQEWGDNENVTEVKEMWAKAKILTPVAYFNNILKVLPQFDAQFLDSRPIGINKTEIFAVIPLRELIFNFFDTLKTVSSGFASLSWELMDYEPSDLVRLDILILGKKEPSLSRIVPKSRAEKIGRTMLEKLRDNIPPQLYLVSLQAAIGGRVIARENIRPQWKDVTAPLYGGDFTRKEKLLKKQRKGKKELLEKARLIIPPDVFVKILKD